MNFILIEQTKEEYEIHTCNGCYFQTSKLDCPKDKDKNIICLEKSLEKGEINLIFKKI